MLGKIANQFIYSWQNISRNSSDAGGFYRKLVLKEPTITSLNNQGMGGTISFD